MVVHREKRCSNASSRGIKSDRSTIQFARATQPVSKVGRGHRSPKGDPWQPRRCVARRVWRILTGSEHRRRKSPASEAPSVIGAQKTLKDIPSRRQKCKRETCFIAVTTARLTARTSRRTPRHHGRRRDPQPKGWTVSDEEAGAERSEALSPLASSQGNDKSGGERKRISFAGMPAHSVRDASASGAIPRSKDLEGGQSPGRIGR